MNTISAAEIETASGGSVEAALSGLRAALADTVLGQLPDGSVTAAKLAPSAGLRDVTAAVHLALDPNFRANRPSDTLCFGYAESLGLLFVQGTISLYAVELGNVGFHARYRYDDYLPRLGTLVPFAVCASAGEAVLSATVGSDMLLDLTMENVPEGTPMVRVAISGWYDCGGEGSA